MLEDVWGMVLGTSLAGIRKLVKYVRLSILSFTYHTHNESLPYLLGGA